MRIKLGHLRETIRRVIKESGHEERIGRQFFLSVQEACEERGFGFNPLPTTGKYSSANWYNGCIANTPELEGHTYVCDGHDDTGAECVVFLNPQGRICVMVPSKSPPQPKEFILCKCEGVDDAAKCAAAGMDDPEMLKLARGHDCIELFLLNQN